MGLERFRCALIQKEVIPKTQKKKKSKMYKNTVAVVEKSQCDIGCI